MLLLLGGGAVLVLIVASANMGSLLLVRTGDRLHEIAIRAAIGASRAQVWRAVALEYAVVVAGGVAASIVLAWTALLAARSALPVEFPRAAGLTLTPSAACALSARCSHRREVRS
jgi:ABC-type antimicrobial peptide transport system permease subunit